MEGLRNKVKQHTRKEEKKEKDFRIRLDKGRDR